MQEQCKGQGEGDKHKRKFACSCLNIWPYTPTLVPHRDGTFFVSDGYCNSRVVKFAANGTYLAEVEIENGQVWGKAGSEGGGGRGGACRWVASDA